MVKEIDEGKAFEQKLKGKMGWKCSCSLDIVDKECSLKQVACKGCGKVSRLTEMLNIALIVRKKDEVSANQGCLKMSIYIIVLNSLNSINFILI